MADTNAFGLPVEPEEPVAEEAVEDSITSESPEAEAAVAEGSPSDEGQPRDERGRFAAREDAPEVDPAAEPEVETPQEPVAEVTEEVTDEGEIDPYEAWLASKPEGLRFANKYDDPRALEKGYSEQTEMWRRANEARKVEAQEKMLLQEQYAALYRQMEEVVPVLQQAATRESAYRQFAERYKEQYGAYPEGYEPPAPLPPTGPADVQAIVDQRLAQERAVLQAQFAAAQEAAAIEGAVLDLYASTPELDRSDELASHQIFDSLQQLDQAWDRYGIEVDRGDAGSLKIIYEATQNPALLEVLKLNPQYFESEYGMELARRDAAILSGRVPATTEPTTARVPASQVKTSGVKKPFQESASIGADAPAGEDESDPWVRVKNAKLVGDATTPSGPKSVFFE